MIGAEELARRFLAIKCCQGTKVKDSGRFGGAVLVGRRQAGSGGERGGMMKVAGVRLGCWGSNGVDGACRWWWVWRCRGRSALVSGLKREVTIKMCWGGRVAKRRGGEGARLLPWPLSEMMPLAPAEAPRRRSLQGWTLLCGSEEEVVAATAAVTTTATK
jgi:hypothetical protein